MNDEARMTNDEGNLNAKMTKTLSASLSHSSFVIVSSFVIRHSSFPS